MTQQIITSLLVGAHFRPPAKTVLAHLVAKTPLILVPEPTNPYDDNAVKVLVSTAEIPQSEWEALRDELPASGHDLDDLLAEEELWLGYIAATGGKPLQARPDLAGNQEILSALTQTDCKATLAFGAEGEPLVRVIVDGGQDNARSQDDVTI